MQFSKSVFTCTILENRTSQLSSAFCYFQRTKEFGLLLQQSSVSTLTVYTDVDWAGCPDTRRSTSGYMVFLSNNLISWSSKRQNIISFKHGG
jgi:hypothetical protein